MSITNYKYKTFYKSWYQYLDILFLKKKKKNRERKEKKYLLIYVYRSILYFDVQNPFPK